MSLSTSFYTSPIVSEIVTTATIISPVIFSSQVTATVTSHLATTLFATYGQTVTIPTPAESIAPGFPSITSITVTSSSPSTSSITGSPIPPFLTTTETSTLTLTETELDIYLIDTTSRIYSTWHLPLTPFLTPDIAPTATPPPGPPLTYVVGPAPSTWDSWSTSSRGGLLAAVVITALVIFALSWMCIANRAKTRYWFSNSWPAGMVDEVSGSMPLRPRMIVPTGPYMGFGHGYVGGLTPRLERGGFDWGEQNGGLRGGGGEEPGCFGMRVFGKKGREANDGEEVAKDERVKARLFSGRKWFSVKESAAPDGEQTEDGEKGAERAKARMFSGKNWFSVKGRSAVLGKEQIDGSDAGGKADRSAVKA